MPEAVTGFSTRCRGIEIPFVDFGKVTSADLFEDREQECFDLYERHRDQYRRAVDIGANIGVHSIIMAKLGWQVRAFEPDPEHFEHLERNISLNGVADRVVTYRHALSRNTGIASFTKVLGNTTASHLTGARSHHGPVKMFDVSVIEAAPYLEEADFAKVDAEGSEAEILCSVPRDIDCDFLVEIGSTHNARRIYGHFKHRAMWAQGPWRRVTGLEDMPTHYRHGSLFIGEKP